MPFAVACLLLAGCGDRERSDAFSFHGMTPGMNAAGLRAAATGHGNGAITS
jgi:hypothetical protein